MAKQGTTTVYLSNGKEYYVFPGNVISDFISDFRWVTFDHNGKKVAFNKDNVTTVHYNNEGTSYNSSGLRVKIRSMGK